MKRLLMKGTEAIAESAIQAGCRYFFGYPITPQNEIPEYMSKRLPEVGGVYLQAESEVSAINMVLGGLAAGGIAMTSSSSPGISLMAEGISFMVGQEIPAVIVNVMRAGPGLGGILPAQSDYNQAVFGVGHGDCRFPVLAPSNLQETVHLVQEAFSLAQKYRTPVFIIIDGVIGQIMEAVEIAPKETFISPKHLDWTVGYKKERGGHKIISKSLFLDPHLLEKHNEHLEHKWHQIEETEKRVQCIQTQDAEVILTAFGTVARIAESVVKDLREEGLKIGLVRPISVHPFPYDTYEKLIPHTKQCLCVEMNWGQMLTDVRRGFQYRVPVTFYGRSGGQCPSVEEIKQECYNIFETLKA